MRETKAIINRNGQKNEVRCGFCGKLLFMVEGEINKDVDKKTQNVIIVARCTRNSCKTDNKVSLFNF